MFIVDKSGKIAFAKVYPLDQAPNNEELLEALKKIDRRLGLATGAGRSSAPPARQRQQTKSRDHAEGCHTVNAPNPENVSFNVRKVERERERCQ